MPAYGSALFVCSLPVCSRQALVAATPAAATTTTAVPAIAAADCGVGGRKTVGSAFGLRDCAAKSTCSDSSSSIQLLFVFVLPP